MNINDMSYLARIHLQSAIKATIKECELNIERCGSLSLPDKKISESSRLYFEKQASDYMQAVEELRQLMA